jgi:feruloyl esterase
LIAAEENQLSTSSEIPDIENSEARLQEIEMIGDNPGSLRMLLYVPTNLPPVSPLVVTLHGGAQNANDYAIGAGWLTLARRFGFAVLCPQQSLFNNANLSFNWFEPADIAREGGEAHSIHQMVAHAISLHEFDANRVFITGLSAGGAMTAVMLATYPDVFAGGAVIAGLAYGAAGSFWQAVSAMSQTDQRSDEELGNMVRQASKGSQKWPPISIWHGDRDELVTPGAGDDLVRQWRNVHGLDYAPVDAKSGDGRSYVEWRSADGKISVEHHRIAGMSHGTPVRTQGKDSCGAVGRYMLDVNISSSFEIAKGWGLAV